MGRKPTIDPDVVYRCYIGPGQQSNTKTASILHIPSWKVYDYRKRFRFDERYAADIKDLAGPAIELTKASIALSAATAIAYLARTVDDRHVDDRTRVIAAKAILDRVDITPHRGGLGNNYLTIVDARRIDGERVGALDAGQARRSVIESMEHNILDVDAMRAVRK